MQVKCEYCNSLIDDGLEKCPYCGATNVHMQRASVGVPATIEELKNWCAQRNMPLEKMRFFIGEDYRGPRAFGIYEENGVFIVYKNKSDGSRAIRYQGTDEDYAVNEIYQKLREETVNQYRKGNISRNNPGSGRANQNRSGGSSKRNRSKWLALIIICVTLSTMCLPGILMGLLFRGTFYSSNSYLSSGYYVLDNQTYYNDDGEWYRHLGDNDWESCSRAKKIGRDNYLGSLYEVNVPEYNFRESGYQSPEKSNYFDYNGDWYFFYEDRGKWYSYSDGWNATLQSRVPLELRKFYDDYATGDWGDRTCPAGISDFRASADYEAERGYYNVDGTEYYNYGNAWYIWSGNDYYPTTEPQDAYQYYDSYRAPDGITDFYDSDRYDTEYRSHYEDDSGSYSSNSDWNSSWDNDYDYGGWDSSDTNWDSDW